MGNVNLVGGQQVAQVDHALLGVRRVAAVGEAAGQLGELVVGVACSTRVTLGHVQRQEARQQANVLVERGQALHVVGVVHVRVLRVQTDKTLGSRLGGLRLGVLVVGVDQLKLGLVGIAPERIARLQCLQLGCGAGVAIIVQVFLS